MQLSTCLSSGRSRLSSWLLASAWSISAGCRYWGKRTSGRECAWVLTCCLSTSQITQYLVLNRYLGAMDNKYYKLIQFNEELVSVSYLTHKWSKLISFFMVSDFKKFMFSSRMWPQTSTSSCMLSDMQRIWATWLCDFTIFQVPNFLPYACLFLAPWLHAGRGPCHGPGSCKLQSTLDLPLHSCRKSVCSYGYLKRQWIRQSEFLIELPLKLNLIKAKWKFQIPFFPCPFPSLQSTCRTKQKGNHLKWAE